MEPNRLLDEATPGELHTVSPRPDALLPDGFAALEPGEMVTIVLRDRTLGSLSGQVLAADYDRITIFESPWDRFDSSSFEEIPTGAIASITRLGSAPLTVTIADAVSSVPEPSATDVDTSASTTFRGQEDARNGALILGIAVAGLGLLAIVTAALSVQDDLGNTETAALRSILGWILFGLALLILTVGLSAARVGRGRYSLTVISLGFGGSLFLFGFPTLILATPFVVSAYLLNRSQSST